MDQATTHSDLDEFLGVQPRSARSRYLKWGAIALGAVLLILLIVRLVTGGTPEASYQTVAVERGDLTVTASATGNLQPTNQVDVGSEVSGRISEVLVDNNDRVRKGQVIARIDLERFLDTLAQSQASVQSGQAAVSQAQASEAQSRATLNRLQQVFKLSGGKVPAATELDVARGEYARAVAGVRSARAQVAQAQAQVRVDRYSVDRGTIISPVNGVVLSRQVEPGQTVQASFNAPVLFIIAEDLSTMKLEAKVDEADVGEVRDGQRATFTVDAFPGRRFPATIKRVDVGSNATASASSSSSSGTSSTATATNTVVSYTAELSVANMDLKLRPGMTATADIVTAERRGVLLIPNAALRFTPGSGGGQGAGSGGGGMASMMMPRGRRGGGGGGRGQQESSIGRGSRQTVYVVGPDGQPKPVSVTVGETNGSRTEVSGPINAGDRVVIGQRSAANGG